MEAVKFAVTCNKNDNRILKEQARAWALQLQVPYVKRYDNGSLDAMLVDHHLDALLIAGKKGMAGAAVLSAKACLRGGVGKLTVWIAPRGQTLAHLPQTLHLAGSM